MMYSDDKILSNGLLFNALRKNKHPKEKLRKIQKYLDQGANINAVDANDRNNSPLHIAVFKRETDVVKFLLYKGANVYHLNIENRTALDIAKLLNIPADDDIVHVLETYTYGFPHSNCREDVRVADASEEIHVTQQEQSHEHLTYNKRPGTSGVSGQLYETKLLSLILLRALNDLKIRRFLLGTNVDGIGAFDDIVLRYDNDSGEKTRILFIQAKHRDTPAKDKITVEEVLKQNGDFSLHKYVDSFIKIRQSFTPESKDDFFKGVFKNMDCDLIIFTSAMENFRKKRVIDKSMMSHLINTTSKGNIFQYEYDDDDIKQLVQTVVNSRLILLAKKLMKYILRNNCSNMMTDELIKEYHVVLARHVIVIERKLPEAAYQTGKIRDTFLTTTDDKLVYLKQAIYKEVALLKNKTLPFQLAEVESILMSLGFDLPAGFGNLNFSISGNENKKRKQLDYLCSKFHKLLRMSQTSANHVVVIDDSMVGPNEILQDADLDTYRIGGLVGNLLILDSVTNMLKFNTDKQYLSDDCIDIYENLKTKSNADNFCKFRLSINVHGFPKLILSQEDNEKVLLKTFLNRLYFYTDQAKEDLVESIVKEEMDKYYNAKGQNNALQLKSDAIYLKVHDKIQNWWKQTKSAVYLTENCNFFDQAQREILDSPLLSIVNFTYKTNLKKLPIEFDDDVVKRLQISTFMSNIAKMLIISTCDVKFTSIKIAAYFDKINYGNKCLFMDYDFVTSEDCFDVINSELSETKTSVLIIVCDRNAQGLHKKIKSIGQVFKEKVILVTNNTLADQIRCYTSTDNIISIIDENNHFNDLSSYIRNKLLIEKKIIFQGIEIPLGNLLDDEECCACVDVSVLKQIVDNNEKIHIGGTLNNPSYDETVHCYIEQRMYRCMTLNIDNKENDILYVINNFNDAVAIPFGIEDIVLITEDKHTFEKCCIQNKSHNVHWFTVEGGETIWRQTYGEIKTIMKYVKNGSGDAYTIQPKTLTDLEEKIIIVSAEPGMGKSTLLTHLAICTKYKDPTVWICKINLLEHINMFMKWKENATEIGFEEAVIFLYMVADFKTFKGIDQGTDKYRREQLKKYIADVIISLDRNIPMKNQDYLSGLELLELKIFHNFFTNGKMILLLDGFDEICPDYDKQVMQLINTLSKSDIAQLWVSTRSNVVTQLEGYVGVFSYTLQPLSVIEQKKYLQKIWSKDLELQDALWTSVHVNIFFNLVSIYFGDKNNQFTSIPLHLFMIAEIFESLFKDFTASQIKHDSYKYTMFKALNLVVLYEKFVDIKFYNIRFGDKKNLMCNNDPDMRNIIERERLAFIEIHKKVAAYFIFSKNIIDNLFDKHEIDEVCDMIDAVKSGVEKTGIIERVIVNEPKFVHLTFAEYFATEFLCDKLKSKSFDFSFFNSVMNTLLFNANCAGVRRFFNSKLEVDVTLTNFNSGESQMDASFDELMWQQQLNSMIFIIEEHLENLTMYLLKHFQKVLKEENIDIFINLVNMRPYRHCLFCASVKSNAKRVVSFLLEVAKKYGHNRLKALYNCDDVKLFNPRAIAFGSMISHPDHDVIELLFKDMPHNSAFLSNLFGINLFGLDIFNEYLLKLDSEQRMQIFLATDSLQMSVAHYAASLNDFRFFDNVEKMCDEEQFKTICRLTDRFGHMPFYYFRSNNVNDKKIDDLYDKIK